MRRLLGFIWIALLVGGIREIYTVVREKGQVTTTLTGLSGLRGSRWVKVTPCKPDFGRVIATHRKYTDPDARKPRLLLVALVTPGDTGESPVRALLATRNPALKKAMANGGDLSALASLDGKEFDLLTKAFHQTEAEGLIQTGFELDRREREDLRDLMPSLAEDFVVIEESRKPSVLAGVLMLATAAGIVVVPALLPARKKGNVAGPAGRSTGPPPPPLPAAPPPLPRRHG